MSASERWGPGGMVTRWLPVPSLPFTVSMNFFSESALTLHDEESCISHFPLG